MDKITDEIKLKIIEDFVSQVNKRAEANIQKTHKLEGSHYAAMTVELNLLREKVKSRVIKL